MKVWRFTRYMPIKNRLYSVYQKYVYKLVASYDIIIIILLKGNSSNYEYNIKSTT